MARRKIREYDAKKLIASVLSLPYTAVLVGPETDWNTVLRENPWLGKEKVVAKPDHLFGKRKQYGLVLLRADWPTAQKWIEEKRRASVTIEKSSDRLTHFLIEPYYPHTEEYYVCFQSQREEDVMYFSSEGGFDIEERWNSVQQSSIPVLEELSEEKLKNLNVPQEIEQFLLSLYKVYQEYHFTYLELNPFTFVDGKVLLLDAVAEVDDCRHKDMTFPRPFGKKVYAEEEFIERLDAHSGSSLKLTILNPQGRIWTIVSGGGASVIYLDTVADFGFGSELANYGEYSGNPTTEESYQYAKTILGLMLQSKAEGKVLFIAGAIANFTDIEKTFVGISKALEEVQEQLKEQQVAIYIRRGGPNYQRGLELMKQLKERTGLQMEIYGPETPMTSIVPMALGRLRKQQ